MGLFWVGVLLVTAVAVPDVVSKLDGLADGDDVRVTTESGHEIEGIVECPDVHLEDDRPRDRAAVVKVLIDAETADQFGAVYQHVSLSATRLRDGWTELNASVPVDVDDHGCEEYESLGEVETVERID